SAWVKANGFDRMPAPTRSVALELHENANAIEAWRATLPERQRKRLIHPLSNVRRWRRAAARPPEPLSTNDDLPRGALYHWRRFRLCLKALPRDQAADLWRTVSAEIESADTGQFLVGKVVGSNPSSKLNLG